MRRLLLLLLALAVFIQPALAVNQVTNGDFETGDLTGWTSTGPYVITTTSNSGTYAAHSSGSFDGSGNFKIYISQNIDFTDVDSFSFYYKTPFTFGGAQNFDAYQYCDINADGSNEWTGSLIGSYGQVVMDVSGYTGVHTVRLGVSFAFLNAGTCTYDSHFDDIVADDGVSPDSNTVEWELESYYTGDTANITSHVTNESWDTGNYSYYMYVYDTASLKTTIPVTTQNATSQYTFSTYQSSCGFLAQLKRIDASQNVSLLAMDNTQFYQSDPTYDIAFDKDEYIDGETMTIYYTDLPSNATVYLVGNNYGSQTWTVSGSGYVNYVADAANTYYFVRAIDSPYTLDTDSADVLASPAEVIINGYCYDSKTQAAIPGVNVTIGDDYCISNAIGWYSITLDAGEFYLTATKDGYQNYNSSVFGYTFGDEDYTFKVYMINEVSAGDSCMYGAVSDYATGQPLGSAYVKLTNTTGSFTDFSDSNGYFEIWNVSNGTYSLSVSRTGYVSHYSNITISSLPDYRSCVLVPEGYVPPEEAPTSPPLVDRNNDGEYSEDEIKDFSMIMLPFFWFMLVLMFFVAFIGRGRQ